MTTTICPRCNSSRLKRSHSRGFKEQLIKITGKRVYRCIHCGWRGILEREERKSQKYFKTYSAGRLVLVIVIVAAALTALLYFIAREPEKTEIKETPGFVIPFVMRRKK